MNFIPDCFAVIFHMDLKFSETIFLFECASMSACLFRPFTILFTKALRCRFSEEGVFLCSYFYCAATSFGSSEHGPDAQLFVVVWMSTVTGRT